MEIDISTHCFIHTRCCRRCWQACGDGKDSVTSNGVSFSFSQKLHASIIINTCICVPAYISLRLSLASLKPVTAAASHQYVNVVRVFLGCFVRMRAGQCAGDLPLKCIPLNHRPPDGFLPAVASALGDINEANVSLHLNVPTPHVNTVTRMPAPRTNTVTRVPTAIARVPTSNADTINETPTPRATRKRSDRRVVPSAAEHSAYFAQSMSSSGVEGSSTERRPSDIHPTRESSMCTHEVNPNPASPRPLEKRIHHHDNKSEHAGNYHQRPPQHPGVSTPARGEARIPDRVETANTASARAPPDKESPRSNHRSVATAWTIDMTPAHRQRGKAPGSRARTDRPPKPYNGHEQFPLRGDEENPHTHTPEHQTTNHQRVSKGYGGSQHGSVSSTRRHDYAGSNGGRTQSPVTRRTVRPTAGDGGIGINRDFAYLDAPSPTVHTPRERKMASASSRVHGQHHAHDLQPNTRSHANTEGLTQHTHAADWRPRNIEREKTECNKIEPEWMSRDKLRPRPSAQPPVSPQQTAGTAPRRSFEPFRIRKEPQVH